MVYGIYNELVIGANLNQLITRGPHIVGLFPTSLCGVLVFDSVSRPSASSASSSSSAAALYNFVPHHLSHTTLSHTIFHTQLCHPPSLCVAGMALRAVMCPHCIWHATVGRLNHCIVFDLNTHETSDSSIVFYSPDLPLHCAQVPFPSFPWAEDALGFQWWAVHLFVDCMRLAVSWCVTWCSPILLQQP